MFDTFLKTRDSCQTYEGGFAGVPGGEAHGGYSYCAIAALSLLGSLKKCNLKSLRKWTANRQMKLEGGFSGRTNKLVDACYSFWQGAVFPLIHDPGKLFMPMIDLIKIFRFRIERKLLAFLPGSFTRVHSLLLSRKCWWVHRQTGKEAGFLSYLLRLVRIINSSTRP